MDQILFQARAPVKFSAKMGYHFGAAADHPKRTKTKYGDCSSLASVWATRLC